MLGTMNLVACVPTTDHDAARAFYEGTLGLRFVHHDGFASVFDANGIMLRISKVPGPFTPFPFTLLGWEVPDIAAAVTALAARGVSFERFGFFEQDALGVWTAPSGDKVAWFKDPAGNVLSVSEHVGGGVVIPYRNAQINRAVLGHRHTLYRSANYGHCWHRRADR